MLSDIGACQSIKKIPASCKPCNQIWRAEMDRRRGVRQTHRRQTLTTSSFVSCLLDFLYNFYINFEFSIIGVYRYDPVGDVIY